MLNRLVHRRRCRCKLFSFSLTAASIQPPDAIQHNGNTYTFTSNLYAAIDILKSNIVLNGAGYTLSGPYNGTVSDVFVIGQGPNQLQQGQQVDYVIGVDLGNGSVCGVTIENLNIENFSIGTYMWTQNNTVKGNSVSNNIVGMLLSGSNNTIIGNVIANNTQGLFFGFNTTWTNTFRHNCMPEQLSTKSQYRLAVANAKPTTCLSPRITGITRERATTGATIPLSTLTQHRLAPQK